MFVVGVKFNKILNPHNEMSKDIIKRIKGEIISAVIIIASFLIITVIVVFLSSEYVYYYFGGHKTLIVIIIIISIFLISRKIKLFKKEVEKLEERDALIKRGIKLKVDLSQVTIKTKKSREAVIINKYSKHRRVEYRDVNCNDITFYITDKRRELKRKAKVCMEADKLRLHFAVKKFTYLYIDTKNPNDEFLDLRFLDE